MAKCYSIFGSIFDSRSSNSTSINQFYDSNSTWLRLQSFGIRLDEEPRVGTPMRRNWPHCNEKKFVHLSRDRFPVVEQEETFLSPVLVPDVSHLSVLLKTHPIKLITIVISNSIKLVTLEMCSIKLLHL